MFNYLSHTTMAETLFKKYRDDGDIINDFFSLQRFKTYSLGVSLSDLKLNNIPHIYGTQKLFFNMIDYIKNNNLTCDYDAVNLLYGHISHYFYDININPYILYLSFDLERVGKIRSDDIIKSYLSNYLLEKLYNKNIFDFKEDCFNNTKISDSSKGMINDTYKKIYNKSNVYRSYLHTINLLRELENVKDLFLFQKICKKMISFKDFLSLNKLTVKEILNKDNNVWYNPVTGKSNNSSYDELLDKAILDTSFAIKEVNQVLYDDKDKVSLEDVFCNLSYDTGEDLKLVEKKYYRKRDRK